MRKTEMSLRQTLIERAGAARSLDPDDVMETIAEYLAAHPAAIAELAPDMTLVPRKLNLEERIEVATAASQKSRREQAEKRHAAALSVIRKALARQSDLSLRELGEILGRAGIHPARSDKWSPASVRYIMQAAGLVE